MAIAQITFFDNENGTGGSIQVTGAAPDEPITIAGTVLTGSSQIAPGTIIGAGMTDGNGNYNQTFPQPTGSYLLVVTIGGTAQNFWCAPSGNRTAAPKIPQARILQVADAAICLLLNNWYPTAPNNAQRVYQSDIPLDVDVGSLDGCQVYFYPASYAAELIDRSERLRTYTIPFLVVERYTGPGDPPSSWMDGVATFVEQQIFETFCFRGVVLCGNVTAAPDNPAGVDVVYDLEMLMEHKVFWSVGSFTLEEVQ